MRGLLTGYGGGTASLSKVVMLSGHLVCSAVIGCRHHSAERNQILTATKRGNGGKTQYLFGLHP